MTNQITVTLDASDLVFEYSGEFFTTSQLVAQVFGLHHHDVLQKIDSLECSDEFMSANFCVHDEFIHAGAVRGKSKLYRMTKDGFMFLVMGLSGKNATATKEVYINTFNQMAHIYPHYYDSGWIPALYRRCQSESHWVYHIKFNVRPRGGKFCATFELGIGGKGKAQPSFSSSDSQFVDSNVYLEYRDLNELWEYIAKVLNKYGAQCPFS